MRKAIIYTLLTLTICACNDSDDISEIFHNRTWKLSFFQEGTTRTSAKAGYSINFYENTLTATTPSGASFSGNWNADNKKRTFRCTRLQVTNGNIANDTTAQKMEKFLLNSSSYEGDANYLKIKQQSNVYMQFHNK